MYWLYSIAIFIILALVYYLYTQQSIKQGFYPYGGWRRWGYPAYGNWGWWGYPPYRGWGWRGRGWRGYPQYVDWRWW